MKSHHIRQQFLDFFEENSHQILSSAPIIVKDDPTLMFTNAGMNQFKNIFLGFDKPEYKQVANSQKCIRVSGKHNDLEEVGHDTYHHTMFEMLGNWSFGEYSKERAIDLAWEFLTNNCNLDKDRIYVTFFEGDKEENLEEDRDSIKFWKKYLPDSRILNGNKQDNFWEMGETGPCGPCSEIHYDNRLSNELHNISGKELVNKDHPDVIEIWNLVFMQFNRKKDGNLDKLKNVQVDTGMGFERLCMIIQNVRSNYDTDLFQPLISELASISQIKYGDNMESDIAMRVISDHLRAVSFSIADGQLPSNVKAGYVIRRILRRAVRYGYTFLDFKEPFLYNLVDTLNEVLGSHYKELQAQRDLIVEVIKQEEISFLRTLDSGLKRIDNMIAQNLQFSGENVFELYDTYGFPRDLTSLILKEKGISYDESEFDIEMAKQKNRSKKSANIDFGEWSVVLSDAKEIFIGHEKYSVNTKISRYRSVEYQGELFYHLVLEETPFYPEGGGQIGDSGYLDYNGAKIEVVDTKKENNLIYHITDSIPNNLSDSCNAIINSDRRKEISRNHTATHLLHYQLRKILGDHVVQKGSLVSDNYLRFDFSHHSAINKDVLQKIEENINNMILNNISLNEQNNISISDAKEMGALMLFGEKYGDKVRVIQFDESKELCGGTHVSSTGEIALFKLISESSVASGVRRIEAMTGISALKLLNEKYEVVSNAESLLKSKDVIDGINKLISENKSLELIKNRLEKESLNDLANDLLSNAELINNIHFISANVEIDTKNLKELSFIFKNHQKTVALLSIINDNKINVGLFISDDLVSKELNAKNLIPSISDKISGSGGGQPHFAVAGGDNPKGFSESSQLIKDILKNR